MTYDIVILGAGTAGMTAAVNAARAGKSVMLLEQGAYGGQIAFSPRVENYPGIKSVSGAEFSDALLEQALSFGVDTELDKALCITVNGDKKIVKCEYDEYEGKAVIIATGASHRMLGLPGEEELCSNGVSYCAVCDGAFFKNRTAAVVGGGDTAVQDAVFLADICSKVYIIHRRDTFRAEKSNVASLHKKKNIECILSSQVSSLVSDELGALNAVMLNTPQGNRELKIDGLFIAVGQTPNTKGFSELLTLDEGGFIKAGEDCKTNIDGIFAAGDCRTKTLRQLTTAAADGAVSAMAACSFIDAM